MKKLNQRFFMLESDLPVCLFDALAMSINNIEK